LLPFCAIIDSNAINGITDEYLVIPWLTNLTL
jgi:hypothetical protein